MTSAEKINCELQSLKDKTQIPYFKLNKFADHNNALGIGKYIMPKSNTGQNSWKLGISVKDFSPNQNQDHHTLNSKGARLFKKWLIDNHLRIPNFLRDTNES